MQTVPQSEALRRIRAKLDRLRVSDRAYYVFGSNGHRYREAPALTDTQLQHLEGALGITLPDELRTFLRYVHGGGPGPGCGLRLNMASACPELAGRPFPYDHQAVTEFLVRKQADRAALLALTTEADLENEWPPRWGFVGLAHLGCDIHSGIVVAGEQRGLIWTCGDIGWIPEAEANRQLGFLEWYEAWLDKGLAQSGDR
jgi:hypothetical protein